MIILKEKVPCFESCQYCKVIMCPIYRGGVEVGRPFYTVPSPLKKKHNTKQEESLYHCITVLLYFCITVSKYHCVTVLLYHCIKLSVYHCVTVSLFHYSYPIITALMYHCIKLSLYHFFTISIKLSLHYCVRVSLFHYSYQIITSLLYHCITLSLYHCRHCRETKFIQERNISERYMLKTGLLELTT